MTNTISESPDLVSILLQQHQTVRTLMGAVSSAEPSARAAAFEPLLRLLAVHETAEEMVVYPALRRHAGKEGERIAKARTTEEARAKKVLVDLEKMDAASAEFLTAFTSFSRDVEEHAAAEEREVFPLLAKCADAEELRGLGVQLQVAESLAPTRPHRNAPESAVGNMLIGPFVAMADRVRDLFHDLAAKH
jgi:hemerythrin superfamily protein